MNRLYATLSQLNQTMARLRSREELFGEVCRLLVELGDFQMAWIGLVDPATRRVSSVAQHGDRLGYLKQLEIFDDNGKARGPVGAAIDENAPCICSDLLEDGQLMGWRETRSGWRSMAVFPVRQQGAVAAVLAVYAREVDYFGPQEKKLLEGAASDISFALETLLNDERRQRAEEQLRQLNGELEQRVRQRTAELEAKNRELEIFTSSVSHDLKSPLRCIDGFSRVVLGDYGNKLDERGRECLRRVISSAERMNQLIVDLLSYSRLDLGTVHWSMVDVSELVRKVVEDYRPEIEAAKTRIKMELQCAPLRADQPGLEQSLRNLVGNAIKFSSKSPGPAVEILGRDGDGFCTLQVRDNGIGFDMRHQERIFQIFQRLHSVSEYPGTGVGLAIVRKALQRMGGTVTAQGEPGKGAVFTLQIPRGQ
jgi:signal transduction histidine kinase